MASSNAKLTQSTTFFARPEDKGSNNVGVTTWLQDGNFNIKINGSLRSRVRPEVYNSIRLTTPFVGGEDGYPTSTELVRAQRFHFTCWNSTKGEKFESGDGDRFEVVIDGNRGRVSNPDNARELIMMIFDASDATERGKGIGFFRTKVASITQDPREEGRIRYCNGFVLVDHVDEDAGDSSTSADEAKARREAARAKRLQG